MRLMWASPWSSVKAIYLAQRYLPFIDTVILNTYWYFLMSFRVWAIWMRNRYMKAMLCALFVGHFLPSAYFYWKFLDGLVYIEPPPFAKNIGCFELPTNNLFYVCWACLAGYDTVAFIMMIIPLARAYYQGGTARMTRVIYEDGIKYYALLFLSSLLNIIIVTTRKVGIMLSLFFDRRVLSTTSVLNKTLNWHTHATGSPLPTHYPRKGSSYPYCKSNDLAHQESSVANRGGNDEWKYVPDGEGILEQEGTTKISGVQMTVKTS
ncbi:hypothetical protein PM082_024182 [Marasmius tenuissimus]|nr:hypothetical protein PM082_024182 [Marasmius tenuissimus]